LLPYEKPWTRGEPHSGGFLHRDAGCVTDDTFVRAQLAQFYLETKPPRTARLLAEWLWAKGDFKMWNPPRVVVLREIHEGTASPETSGLTARAGGGLGWWQTIGIVYAGNPKGAAAEMRNLARIWKAPLEMDIQAGSQAGVAEACRDGATVDSVLSAILAECGPLARKLLDRAIDIAHKAKTRDELIHMLYHTVLIQEEPTRDADGPMPPHVEPLEDSDSGYAVNWNSEQIALSVAAFLFEKGDPIKTLTTCVMIGRDCDTTASAAGAWVGGLHGESCWPKEWVDAIYKVNLQEIDIRTLGEKLVLLPE
jgi:hypothetical protein